MTLRTQLKNLKRSIRGRRWTIREKDGYISEVKMIFNPEEYAALKSAREMYTDKALLKILEKDYEKKKNNS